MHWTNVDITDSTLKKGFSELIRQAVRTEIQEVVRLVHDEDRPLTIDQVADVCLFRGIGSTATERDSASRVNSDLK